MKITPVTILCFFAFFCAEAKENKDLMKANYYYSHYAYAEAIPYFEKVAGSMNDPVIYSELADCYSVTSNLQKAAEAYGLAAAIKGCSSAVILRYAQLLMQLTRYDEAAKWLTEYLKTNHGDHRAANILSGCKTARVTLDAIPQGTVVLLPFNTEGSEFAPTRWKDKLVFASDTAIDTRKKTDSWTGRSYYNIYSIDCDKKGNCGKELNKLTETKQTNTRFHDGPCTFSGDGKQMYYTRSRSRDGFLSKGSISNKDSVVLLEIMIASDYDTSSRKFKTIRPFEYNSDEYSVAHPSVTPNGKLLVFSSTKPKGQGGSDLYVCRNVRGNWAKPTNAGSVINTEGEEVFPYWADDSTLFFSSDGLEGLGGLDIYKTTWNDQTGTFSRPENIGTPINSSYDDISLALYADGRSTYFSSSRPAAKGGDNIYFYKKEKVFLQLQVVDSLTRQAIPAPALVIESAGARRDTAADGSGSFFQQLYPERPYTVTVSKTGYRQQQVSFTATTTREADTILKIVSLYMPPVAEIKKVDTLAPVPLSFTKLVGVPEVNKVYEIGHFYFAYDRSDLNDTAKVVLDSLVDFLAAQPTMRIQIRAHTDCRGGDAYNMKLSEARALAVMTYLKNKGIATERLSSVGLGMREPKIPCPVCEQCTEQEYYLNRVLEFKILRL